MLTGAEVNYLCSCCVWTQLVSAGVNKGLEVVSQLRHYLSVFKHKLLPFVCTFLLFPFFISIYIYWPISIDITMMSVSYIDITIYLYLQVYLYTCINWYISIYLDVLVLKTVKNLSAVWETWVQSLGWEDPLEKGMATHSSILDWEIPWTEEPSGLQFMGLQTVGHGWATNTHTHTHTDLYTYIYIRLYVCDLLSQKRKPNYIYIPDAFIYVQFMSSVEAFTIATNFLLYESSVAPNFSFAIWISLARDNRYKDFLYLCWAAFTFS